MYGNDTSGRWSQRDEKGEPQPAPCGAIALPAMPFPRCVGIPEA
jgi:hypothetical protein